MVLAAVRFFLPYRVPLLEDCPDESCHVMVLTRFADGFFDSGLLRQALKASQQGSGGEGDGAGQAEEPLVAQARRAVGKKLRLSEY